MNTSHPERRTPTFRQFAMVMAAVTWFALLLPVGAGAAGQLVTLVDPTTSSKARVDAGSLRVAVHNDPARLPFGISKVINVPTGQLVSLTRLTIAPRGYELVVDTLSVAAAMPPGQRLAFARIVYPDMQFFIPLSFMASEVGVYDTYQGAESVQLYMHEGDVVRAGFERSASAGVVTVIITLSGHLVRL